MVKKKPMPSDFDLLEDFVSRSSEDAFRALVERHSGMVHAAALRTVGDAVVAQEVTQAVFILLARKANRLPRATILAGWLYRSARLVAMEARRAESRRQKHQREFAHMNATVGPDALWKEIAPLLEEAVCSLSAADRSAIVLRFFEDKSFGEVASALGTAEGAAKMRVKRALEKLRTAFARRGVVIPATALFAALSAHGMAAAPAGLAALASTAALAQPGAVPPTLLALVEATNRCLLWSKIKAVAFAASLALLTVGGLGLVAISIPRQSEQAPSVVMSTFAPMAGTWEGFIESSGSGMPTRRQAVTLTVSSADNGRSCAIEMVVSGAGNLAPGTYRFRHTLNQAGDRIYTESDRRTGRGNGVGTVTEYSYDPTQGEWSASFRFPFANASGVMHGRWARSGDALRIASDDAFFDQGAGARHLHSDIQLRLQTASANPASN